MKQLENETIQDWFERINGPIDRWAYDNSIFPSSLRTLSKYSDVSTSTLRDVYEETIPLSKMTRRKIETGHGAEQIRLAYLERQRVREHLKRMKEENCCHECEQPLPPKQPEWQYGDPVTLDSKTECLELNIRADNILNDQNIRTIRQLLEKTPIEILKMRKAGQKTLKEFREVLADFDLCLSGDDDFLKNYNKGNLPTNLKSYQNIAGQILFNRREGSHIIGMEP